MGEAIVYLILLFLSGGIVSAIVVGILLRDNTKDKNPHTFE